MYYCGIDVAKHNHTAIVINEKGEVIEPAQQVDNDQEGLNQLTGFLFPYQRDIVIGLEATGHYWLALFERLALHKYPITVLNPMQVRTYRKIDIRKRKTDRKDSFWIADFMRFSNPGPSHQDIPTILQLRELSRFRFRLTQQVGDCNRKIISILDRVFRNMSSFLVMFSSKPPANCFRMRLQRKILQKLIYWNLKKFFIEPAMVASGLTKLCKFMKQLVNPSAFLF